MTFRIVSGLVLGIATGLFFGEKAASLQPIADVWIGLMQMTVLPYVIVSLISGLGQLDATLARLLAVRGGYADDGGSLLQKSISVGFLYQGIIGADLGR